MTVNLSVIVAQNTVGAGTDTLGGVENLTGSAFNDTLTGDNNANTLTGDNNANTLTGGTGVDSTSYAAAPSGVSANLATGAVTGGGGADKLVTMENVTGSAFNDTLTGNGSANALDGGDGNDVVNGGAGDDALTGGNGIDTVSYAGSSGGVTVNLSLASAQNTRGAGNDTLTGFENLKGSGSADKLTTS